MDTTTYFIIGLIVAILGALSIKVGNTGIGITLLIIGVCSMITFFIKENKHSANQ